MSSTMTQRKTAAATKQDVYARPEAAHLGTAKPSKFNHIKFIAAFAVLSFVAIMCYVKANILQEEVDAEWEVFVTHCQGKEGEPSAECADHAVHLHFDETMIECFWMATYASGALSLAALAMPMIFTREQLNSNVL